MRRYGIILIMALIGMVVALFSLPSLAGAPQYYPLEIAVDNSGNVYVIMGSGSAAGAGVYVYTPDGKQVKYSDVDEYSDLAIADSILYLSNVRKNYVELVAANGSSGIFWREESPGRFIDYIATDHNGILYVSDFYYSGNPAVVTSGRILKISPNGTVMGAIESSQTMPMDRPFKLSVSDNGTIYMTDSSIYVRAIYPDDGRSSITLASAGQGKAERLVDVATGADGYLYVTESTGGYVYKLAANGAIVTKWGGCGPMKFVTPFGVTTGGNGRVFVSDMQNQRVVWFDGDRYRFGDNLTENIAGKGVLWDNVMDAGNVTVQPLPGDEIMPRQSIPGYTAAIAFIGICLAGVFLYLCNARRN